MFFVLMPVIMILSSCDKFRPESLIAEPWHRILSFKYEGETKVTITSASDIIEGGNPLTILRTGSDITTASDAMLCLMSEEDTEDMSSDYRIIDQSFFQFESSLHFTSGQTGKTVQVSINGGAILEKMRSDQEHTYVLPFTLESADSVNVYKNHMVFVFVDPENRK